jgi:hypothetical protein
VEVTLRNQSNTDYIFSSGSPLEISTPEDSPLFLNDEWLSPRTVYQVENGFVKAQSEKVVTIKLQIPMIPDEYEETLELQYNGETVSESVVNVESQDTGMSILRVLPTGLGYLRIREEPTTSSEEIGRAAENLYYEYTDTDNGFYKIKFGEEREGWISGNYIQVIN